MTIVALAASPALTSASNNSADRYSVDPYPAKWTDESGLTTPRFGRLGFVARDGNELTARTYRATQFDELDGPILFVIHGASREIDRYINTIAPVAERHNALAIAIHFSKEHYPRSKGFTLHVVTEGDLDERALAENRWRQPEDYLHAEIEHVFEAVRSSLNGQQTGYYLFGHSAGAQFTHRLITFLPDARVTRAVAANAGWYTLPVSGSRSSYTIPYGLRGTPLTDADVRMFLATPMIVMVGERDVSTPGSDRLVRGTREALMQGRNRRERAEYYFELGQARARELDTSFGWQFAVAPRAAHSSRQLIGTAEFYLFDPEPEACISDSADIGKKIFITEILADPPRGTRGDANRDGTMHPQEDEFVELTNTGSVPVCMSGWALGDANNPERHVFPEGHPLQPQETIVIFGGGIPTGSFGDARVQWASFSGKLGLNNDGDVLTLRDRAGDIVTQISWGDCDEKPCATFHLDKTLGINSSIFRHPESPDHWQIHADVSPAAFSPGVSTAVSRPQLTSLEQP